MVTQHILKFLAPMSLELVLKTKNSKNSFHVELTARMTVSVHFFIWLKKKRRDPWRSSQQPSPHSQAAFGFTQWLSLPNDSVNRRNSQVIAPQLLLCVTKSVFFVQIPSWDPRNKQEFSILCESKDATDAFSTKVLSMLQLLLDCCFSPLS